MWFVSVSGTLQKNLAPSSLQYNQGLGNTQMQGLGNTQMQGLGNNQMQGLGNTPIQPSQMFIQYEPSLFGANPLLGNTQTQQNVNSSQLMGSTLVQPR